MTVVVHAPPIAAAPPILAGRTAGRLVGLLFAVAVAAFLVGLLAL